MSHHLAEPIPRLRLTAVERSYSRRPPLCATLLCRSQLVSSCKQLLLQNHPLQVSVFAAHSSLSAMSQVASAAHTTTTAFAVRNHSKAVSCSIPRRSPFQRKTFVGDRLEHRQPVQTRALYRSHTVCITKVDEAGFQEEVLKVGHVPVDTRHCQRQ